MSFYVLLCIWLTFGASHCSQELSEGVKYDVILKTKDIAHREEISQNLDMVSKYGQRFTCHLPTSDNENRSDSFLSLNNSYIHSLLSPLNHSKCIFLTKDWWTYELCYGRLVLQFHEEQGNKLSETLLGRFESETNWDVQTNSNNTDPKFHSQFFTNGSVCDLTNKPRTTEVRYTCGSGTSFHIISVDETETCNYLLIVEAPMLCAHPAFVAKISPKVEEIVCAAVSVTSSDEKNVHGASTESQSLDDNEDRTRMVTNSRSQQKRSFTLKKLYSNIHTRHQKFRAHQLKMAIKNFNHAIHLLEVDNDMASLYPSFVWRLMFQSLASNKSVRHASFPQFMRSYELQVIVEQFATMLSGLISSTRSLIDHETSLFTIPTESVQLVCDLGKGLVTALEMKISEASGYFVALPYNVSHLQVAINSFKMIYTSLLGPEAPKLSYDYLKRAAVPPSNEGQQQQHVFDQIILSDRSGRESCPKVVEKLRTFVYVFRHNLLTLRRLAANLLRIERLQDTEAKLESTFRGLAQGGKYNVLLVRSATSSKSKTDDTKASPRDDENPAEKPGAETKPVDPILALLHKVIKKVAPHISKELEIYQTNILADGYSTFFIMTNEEKTKEERRIQEQEKAYRFVQNARNRN